MRTNSARRLSRWSTQRVTRPSAASSRLGDGANASLEERGDGVADEPVTAGPLAVDRGSKASVDVDGPGVTGLTKPKVSGTVGFGYTRDSESSHGTEVPF